MKFLLLVLLVSLSTVVARAQGPRPAPRPYLVPRIVPPERQVPPIVPPVQTPVAGVTPSEEVRPTTLSRPATASEASSPEALQSSVLLDMSDADIKKAHKAWTIAYITRQIDTLKENKSALLRLEQ